MGWDLSTKLVRQCRWWEVLSSLVRPRGRQECQERLGTGTRLWTVCSWRGFLQHTAKKSQEDQNGAGRSELREVTSVTQGMVRVGGVEKKAADAARPHDPCV